MSLKRSPRPRFQRARKPEEKEVRRQAILAAARTLMREVGSMELSLSELARRSGVSKPNIYRYFESREEVLLQVWVEEMGELGAELAASFAHVRRGDAKGVARAIVAAFAARPMLCELTSVVSSVLERNLSVDAIRTAKRTLVVSLAAIAEQLHDRLPAIPLDRCAWAAATIATYVIGLWPAANPAPAQLEACATPEFAPFRLHFEPALSEFLGVLFAGLTAGERG